jgi:hypothetical protein
VSAVTLQVVGPAGAGATIELPVRQAKYTYPPPAFATAGGVMWNMRDALPSTPCPGA